MTNLREDQELRENAQRQAVRDAEKAGAAQSVEGGAAIALEAAKGAQHQADVLSGKAPWPVIVDKQAADAAAGIKRDSTGQGFINGVKVDEPKQALR
jgi:hypothetical protein